MRRLTVRHVTTYRYAKPVTFGDHRLMLRPRDSHDLRLLAATVKIDPAPSSLRWLHDVFGNSVAVASFDRSAAEIQFDSILDLEHFEKSELDYPIEPYAEAHPFSYSADELPDLQRSIERHYPDPEHRVDFWARRFISGSGPTKTLAMLTAMTQSIKQESRYVIRYSQGCQNPAETLRLKSGSCRDFALLMIEAVRTLGFAARFVSGYVYIPPSAESAREARGAATHAWVQVYLPGAGWMEFDPTNGGVGNRDLIRVAVARDPKQAVPISGTWTGIPGDFLGMQVDVSVSVVGREEESTPRST